MHWQRQNSSYEMLKKLTDFDLKEFAEEFDITAKIDEREVRYSFYGLHPPCKRYSRAMNGNWINRKMDRGWVHLSREKLSRIIEEAIRKRIGIRLAA